MERILEEARKDPTYRKVIEQGEAKLNKEGKPDSDDRRERERDRGKPKARPGRK
jgi:YidC/Oxa1 family membrane protein insertase